MTDENKQLEEEFLALASTMGEQIKAKVEQAEKSLEEAVELADRYGIPFYANISPIGQSYVPDAFEDRFSALETETVAELLNLSEYDLDHRGWERSQIC